jgi:protein SMG6
MLFTRVQLDDFNPTLGRFLERLELDGAEEREWTMMAVTNIAAVLEYGKATGVIKKAGGINSRESQHTAGTTKGVRVASRRDGDSSNPNAMDVDTPTVTVTVSDSPQPREAQLSAEEVPLPFTLALELTFAMLSHTLRKPKRKASPYAPSTVNPYPVIILTFLATVLKHGPTRDLLERAVPWKALATFLSAVPRMAMAQTEGGGPLLPLQGAAPLPEDWCLRGMEWVGRRVYPAGFWKAGQSQGQNQSGELEVLDQREPVGPDEDGIIEDDAEDGAGDGRGVSVARWVRLARAGVHISKCVSGLERMDGARTWEVRGQLGEKVAAWAEEDRLERETEEARKRAAAAARTSRKDGDEDWMMVDEDEDAFGYLDDLEDDTEEVRNLKVCHMFTFINRWLQVLTTLLVQDRLRHLRGQQHNEQAAASAPRPSKGASATGPSLKLVPGYTVLVLDTNVLLASLPMVAALVERHAWTVVVPLPVIMELDGLAQNQHGNGNTALGEAAAAAASYITTAVRSHAISLKVQTSRGNYLPGLAVRAESVEFDAGAGWERSMDDLILRTAVFAEEHWVDRSAMLRSNMGADIVDVKGAEKVVLMTLDRNREYFSILLDRLWDYVLMNCVCSSIEGTWEEAACGERARSRGCPCGLGMSGMVGLTGLQTARQSPCCC